MRTRCRSACVTMRRRTTADKTGTSEYEKRRESKGYRPRDQRGSDRHRESASRIQDEAEPPVSARMVPDRHPTNLPAERFKIVNESLGRLTSERSPGKTPNRRKNDHRLCNPRFQTARRTPIMR